MSDEIILPTADEILTPVLEKMYEEMPACFQHLNLRSGVFWHPILGFRAQTTQMLNELADRALARRLKTAEGQDLLDYVASEFSAVPNTAQTFAEGTVTLARKDSTLPTTGGDYPKGTRITRGQYTFQGVTFAPAEYETLADAHISSTSSAFAVTAIPIRATRAGTHANAPLIAGQSGAQNITVPNFASNIGCNRFEAGGGSDGPNDEFVRAYAKTYARGQYGPTNDASKLGALSGAGVRRFLVFDHAADGTQVILIGDYSWGSSARWAGIVKRAIFDDKLVGFGCKISVQRIYNKVINIDAEISLRDSNYLSETTDIDDAVRTAARSYFDDRPDWNLWNENALCVAISKSHPRILNCNHAIVRDISGDAVDEILIADYSQDQLHMLLASNAMQLSYVGPA